jgi:hypothetical protein
MHPYHKEGLEWAKTLANCSDQELVDRHNSQVRMRCYGFARQMYMGCLQKELLARDFDSSILFERDNITGLLSYITAFKVEISERNGRRILVATSITKEAE